MKRKAIGFYWTLPAPWAGFTDIGKGDVDEAARRSRTIRYQREACRRHAREHGLDLIHEVAFLETEPDRGTEFIRGPLEQIAPLCRDQHARVLYVDFKVLEGWRRNDALHAEATRLGLRLDPVWPRDLPLDDGPYDPAEHFSAWRHDHQRWMADKPARAATARTRALDLAATGAKNPAIAATLNAEGLPTPTGKEWTADALRKFLALPTNS
ncbi:recombinase family protein [Novosphingobium bradum]|uniref:Recombinase family protein n=1 Tax=Novosphingobium bradum TaxID=1737444 RepID=A0ABV7ISS6_9SPHN